MTSLPQCPMTAPNPARANQKQIDHKFLYRALRPVEIKRRVLIPKKPSTPFVYNLMFPLEFPVRFGEQPEHAVRAQQLDSEKYKTSGLSTTPHLKRAEHYAKSNRTIVRIAVEHLATHGIEIYRVADYVPASLIIRPEDDEVILVRPGKNYLPKAIIVEFIELAN
jgi:hypothetical protein